MVRYKVKLWEDNEYVVRKGWCAGTNFSEGSEVLEKYYGEEICEMSLKLFDNYDDVLIEDNYLADSGAEDDDF